MKHINPSPRANKLTKGNRTHHILSNGQWVNRPIHDIAGVRAIFEELGDAEQKDLLIELAQDFT